MQVQIKFKQGSKWRLNNDVNRGIMIINNVDNVYTDKFVGYTTVEYLNNDRFRMNIPNDEIEKLMVVM